MNKYIKGLIVCGLAGALFTGCAQSSEALLASPKGTITKASIKDLVKEEIGEKVTLMTPNNRTSSIVKLDMDGDGDQEVVLFYNNNDKHIGIGIIDEVDGKETIKRNIKIAATTFEKVFIEDIDGDNKKEIFMGSSYGMTMPKVINIATLDENKYVDVYANSYEDVAIYDINNDGIGEIILIDRDEKKELQYLSVYKMEDKKLKLIDKTQIDYGTVNQLICGMVKEDTTGIFVDTYVGAHAGSTNLLILENNKLRQPIAEDEGNWDLLWNPYPVKCRDIDGDGILDFPQLFPLASYDDSPMSEVRYMKTWSKWDGKTNLINVMNSISNYNMSYELNFKEKINDKISVKQIGEDAISDVFFEFKDDKKTEIFKIVLLHKEDSTKHLIKYKGNNFYYLEVLNDDLFKAYGFGDNMIRENLNAL